LPKLLIIGDAGVHSGFGTVVHSIGERLVRDFDWEVSVIAANYRGDWVDTNLRLYVANQLQENDIHGLSRYVELLGKIGPDALLFVNDPSVVVNSLFRNVFDENRILLNGVQMGGQIYRPPILAYMPIDGYESPGSWDALIPRVTRIAMSHHGQTAMPEAPVIWHGVDTNVFKPRNKKESKKALGFDPERFLVIRVDKNYHRKDFAATWKALRPVLRKYSDISVHFHCQPQTPQGHDLYAVMWNDKDIRDRVSFSPNLGGYNGWGLEELATLYSAADLFVSTSHGEGFGLTLLEAIASGTPVIAGDHSAITEVVGPGGVLIPPAGRITNPMGQEQCLPDIERYSAEIEHLYKSGGVRRKLAQAGVAHAKQFTWDEAARRLDARLRQEVAKGVLHAVPEQQRPAGDDQVEVPQSTVPAGV
jgi:glycosyltransferase involved in cell wall biosynthesis